MSCSLILKNIALHRFEAYLRCRGIKIKWYEMKSSNNDSKKNSNKQRLATRENDPEIPIN